MLVGEAPGAEEERAGLPFIGASGKELTKMLHEAGIIRSECFITNVCRVRPPKNDIGEYFVTKTEANKRGVLERDDRYPLEQIVEGLHALEGEIEQVKPKLIIALGNTALWALTGEWGITSWRGSYLSYRGIPVVPTYHPAGVMRQWSWRPTAVHDLKRAKRILTEDVPEPHYSFTIFAEVNDWLDMLEAKYVNGQPWVSVDIETWHRHIACLGLSIDEHNAICIPFMREGASEGYWDGSSELHIIQRLRYLLTKMKCIGQNFIYDMQYIIRHWAFKPNLQFDTMIAHAVAFPGTPKGLDYLSSMYCRYHRYWKDESKDWDPHVGERQLWEYNCKDCVTTWECQRELFKVLEHFNLYDQFQFEMDMLGPVLSMMLRGVRIDTERKSKMAFELLEAASEREAYLHNMIDGIQLATSKTAKPWYRSPRQQMKLFYEVLGLPTIYHRKTRKPTVDDEALPTIAKREPLLFPLIERLQELRSIGVFSSTFVQMPLDHDMRARCSYNVVGTETFRFNSSQDAFGFGTNLQNIPRSDD